MKQFLSRRIAGIPVWVFGGIAFIGAYILIRRRQAAKAEDNYATVAGEAEDYPYPYAAPDLFPNAGPQGPQGPPGPPGPPADQPTAPGFNPAPIPRPLRRDFDPRLKRPVGAAPPDRHDRLRTVASSNVPPLRHRMRRGVPTADRLGA